MSLAVGDGIQTMEELDALPVGAQIGPYAAAVYTKHAGGWTFAGGAYDPDNFRLGGHNKVMHLPPALPAWAVVGAALDDTAKFEVLPVGTVIRRGSSAVTHTKHQFDLWVSSPGGHHRRNAWFGTDGRHHIESLPQGVLTQNGEQGMTVVQNMEEFDALAVGTVVTAEPSNNTWTKQEDDLWTGLGTTLRSRYFVTDVQQGRIKVGVALAAGQLYQDGYYAYLLLGADTERPGNWKAIQFYGEAFNNVVSQQTYPGTLADPTWTTERMRSLGNAMAMERAQKEDYARGRDDAVRESADRQGYLTTVQNQLHRFVGAHSDMREEINAILTGVELQAAPVTVLATVIANITETKRPTSEAAVEALKSMITLPARAERPVSLATAALISYQVELKMPVPSPEGACACGRVTRAMGIEHLRQQGVALHSYERVSRWCAAETCEHRRGPDPEPEPF